MRKININKIDVKLFDATKYTPDVLEANLKKAGIKHLFPTALYHTFTGQRVLGLSISKESTELEAIKKELIAIMPFLKPDVDGICEVQIYEHTEGKEGSYSIAYNVNDKDWAIILHFNSSAERHTFMTLDEALETIREKHYKKVEDE